MSFLKLAFAYVFKNKGMLLVEIAKYIKDVYLEFADDVGRKIAAELVKWAPNKDEKLRKRFIENMGQWFICDKGKEVLADGIKLLKD